MSNSQEMPSVQVLLLNWNSSEETLECLESIKNSKYPNFEVVIVDNGSQDDSLKNLQQFKVETQAYPITILKNKENLGFAGGNNVGIRHAIKGGADYVFILNNDTCVAPNTLTELILEAEKDKKVGLAVPAVYFTKPDNILWFGGKTKIQWRKMDKAISSSLFKKEMPAHAKPQEISFATGAAMFIKREVLEKVQGFDDRFFLYFEDADLSLRIQKAGWDLVWVPGAKIWHKVSATTLPKLGSASLHYYNHRNILLLARKHSPWWVKYFYMHAWAIYKYSKQIIKITVGFNKEVSGAIKHGIGDYYKNKFYKYD